MDLNGPGLSKGKRHVWTSFVLVQGQHFGTTQLQELVGFGRRSRSFVKLSD